MSKQRDHIKVRNTAFGGYGIHCTHCDLQYAPAMPVSIDIFLAILKTFGKEHEDCLPLAYQIQKESD